MFRKLIVRLLLCVVAAAGVIVLVIGITGYLALKPPAFYAELRSAVITERDQRDAEAAWQRMEQDLWRWNAGALARQQPAAAAAARPVADASSVDNTYLLTVTEKQLNALLASNDSGGKRDWQCPRIHLGRDSFDIGFELVTSQLRCVLSAELKPTINAAGRLRLDLVSARVGRLPLPMRTIFGWLPREAFETEGDLEVNLSDPTRHICVDLSSHSPNSPLVKSITCGKGAITLELLPPVPSRPKGERNPTPLALSGD